MTTAAALVTVAATRTSEHLPANRLAVSTPVFDRLFREHLVTTASCEELHVTKGDDTLDALDDDLRDRAQTVGEFVGAECFALFTGRGIDGCDVWALVTVGGVEEPQTAAEVVG